MTLGKTGIPNNLPHWIGDLSRHVSIRVRFPVWNKSNYNNMFNWKVFLKMFSMLTVSLFILFTVTTALAIIGALIHPFVGIILPVIGVIIMTALVAYEH